MKSLGVASDSVWQFWAGSDDADPGSKLADIQDKLDEIIELLKKLVAAAE